jgi:MYXO-CTERM domain-containing protein
MARGIDPAIATAIGSGDATTARDLATPAIHEEAGLQARGIGQTVPGNDEATLIARGIDPAIATAIGTGDATTARDLATPTTPDSGTSFELPSVDAGTAAVVGGLAGAGLLILGGAFAVRRQRVTPV